MPECYVIHTLLVFLHSVVVTSMVTYMNVCVCVCVCIYIYIYIERERERDCIGMFSTSVVKKGA